MWWLFHNGQTSDGNLGLSFYGWREYGDLGIVNWDSSPYPAYRAEELLTHWARGGAQIVLAASNFPPELAVYAAKEPLGNKCSTSGTHSFPQKEVKLEHLITNGS